MIKKYNYVPFLDDGDDVDYNNYMYWPDVFSHDECNKIISIGTSRKLSAGLVEADKSNSNTVYTESNNVRRSKIAWLGFDEDTSWIYERIHEYANYANIQNGWNFRLYGFLDGLQFTEYNSEYKGHYNYHSDLIKNPTARKLSCVVQLSDENDYTGGEFELFGLTGVPKNRGTIIFFPSFLVHKVSPVTSGIRYSLVSWIAGPKFI